MKKSLARAAVVQVITVSGTTYLGIREGSTITGLSVGSTISGTFLADYLKAKEVNTLVSIDVGSGSDITVRDLNPKEVIAFDTVKAQFAAAKKMSKGWLVNRVFDEFRGKN